MTRRRAYADQLAAHGLEAVPNLRSVPLVPSEISLTPDAAKERILRGTLVFACVAVVLKSISQLANGLLFDNHYYQLSADVDGNTWSWASATPTFTVGLMALFLAFLDTGRARRFYGLALVTAYLSLDDAIGIHDRLAGKITTWLGISYDDAVVAWVVFLGPLLLLTFAVVWGAVREAQPRARVVARAGLALLVFAVFAEAVGTLLNHVGYDHDAWPYDLEVTFEEGAELAAWILITGALACETFAQLCGRFTSSPSTERR
jgi:hypothetical protein